MFDGAIERQQLLTYLNQLLQNRHIRDYCPNGLQVEGRDRIRHIVTGVTANQALIDEAIALGADTLLVHHGYFWKGENACITGIKRERLKALLAHDINLLAYHLPLDIHPELGNNTQLADILELTITGPIDPLDAATPGLIGHLPKPMTASEFSQWIGECLDRTPLHIGEDEDIIETVAWCTGGAEGYLQLAIDAGVDAYITGEINEPAVHLARETGTHFYSAGHHATERYGVLALGQQLEAELGIKVTFIDIDNPV
ncbi:Nif3-like dinuclear metal center hexameric protein [Oceanobacter sp. 4_MG-2023]|uniref:Nif3-like dinuclear metal center hexameric protein n=1 Tax=Oceanobacter sp. 4_MG-2023 TaxID=3062623 RepID=UPI0027323448|nr:Nif3-like dinuclear metal center hexameric protein [Oceanobacter sp. 4_MG-2023]MDP2548006.1 Nif3-like dinuclear metal center hexameric protein [Oceanobacter sp. 4_MG-2023]